MPRKRLTLKAHHLAAALGLTLLLAAGAESPAAARGHRAQLGPAARRLPPHLGQPAPRRQPRDQERQRDPPVPRRLERHGYASRARRRSSARMTRSPRGPSSSTSRATRSTVAL